MTEFIERNITGFLSFNNNVVRLNRVYIKNSYRYAEDLQLRSSFKCNLKS